MYAISKVSPKTPYLGKMDPTIPAMQGPRKKNRRKVQYVWCLSTKKSFIAVDRLLRTMFDANKSKADMVLQQQYLTDSFLWSVLISELDFKENIMQHMICLGSVSNSELIYSLLLQTTQKAKILLILNVSVLSVLVQTLYDKILNTIPTGKALSH